jgi:hypothetical protein
MTPISMEITVDARLPEMPVLVEAESLSDEVEQVRTRSPLVWAIWKKSHAMRFTHMKFLVI